MNKLTKKWWNWMNEWTGQEERWNLWVWSCWCLSQRSLSALLFESKSMNDLIWFDLIWFEIEWFIDEIEWMEWIDRINPFVFVVILFNLFSQGICANLVTVVGFMWVLNWFERKLKKRKYEQEMNDFEFLCRCGSRHPYGRSLLCFSCYQRYMRVWFYLILNWMRTEKDHQRKNLSLWFSFCLCSWNVWILLL